MLSFKAVSTLTVAVTSTISPIPQTTTPELPLITPALYNYSIEGASLPDPLSQFNLPANPASTEACTMRVVEYFDPKSLADIDRTLSNIHAYLYGHALTGTDLVDAYFESRPIASEEDFAIAENLSHLALIESHYEPGTEQGLTFLKASPLNVVNAAALYVGHIETLKSLLTPQAAANLEHSIGQDATYLEKIAAQTTSLLETQAEASCLDPVVINAGWTPQLGY